MKKQLIKTKVFYLVFTPELFDLVVLGTYNGLLIASESTILYSLLITYHPESKKDIQKIRNELNIVPILYPDPATNESLYNISNQFTDIFKKSFNMKVVEYLNKYKLDQKWKLPVQIKLLTNRLPVPSDSGKFEWYEGRASLKEEKDTLLYLAKSYYFQQNSYPALLIKERIEKKNELITWINKHWDYIIKPTLNHLPKRKMERVSLETISLGLWIIEQREINPSWDCIEEKISELETKDPDFFGKNGIYTKSRTDLQKIMSDVEHNYLQRFYNY